MAARDMAGFMCDDADDLSRIFRPHQQAGIDKQALPPGDEGIQRRIVDDMYLDVACGEPGCFENGPGVDADGIFYFGVADKRNSPCRRQTGQRNQDSAENRQKTGNIFG